MFVSENRKAFNRREMASPADPLVCIAEQETKVGISALGYLERDGFVIRVLAFAPDVIDRIDQLNPAVVIVRTAISSSHAIELCRAIRSVQSLTGTPLILLAEHASEDERVFGLESGADDYITESSSGREIVARVRAVMRRIARQEPQLGPLDRSLPVLHSLVGVLTPTIRRGDIELDPSAMKIWVRGTEIMTTSLEFRLLYYLMHNQSRVFSRDQLLEAVWGTRFVESRSVDACVRRLRHKIEPDPLRPTYLRTIRGAGYSLRASAA
jgi:DNA-binding response OmpR family regulator